VHSCVNGSTPHHERLQGDEAIRNARSCHWMHSLGLYKRYNKRRRRFTWPSFDVPLSQLLYHVHIIGKTGMGKSTFQLNQIMQDISAGRGCIILDPKGQLATDLLPLIPPSRRRDVIYFAPFDTDYPIGYNVLDCPNPLERNKVASKVLDAFHHRFASSWGPQLEQILKSALLAVVEMQGGTLLDVKFMLTHKAHRARVLAHVKNDFIRDFWEGDFETHMTDKEQRDRTLSTLNKISQLIVDPMLCNIVRQPSAFSFIDIMDSGKIFIANLDQGQMGEDASALLGGLMISGIYSAALSRKSRDFFPVYVDEFHLFGSTTFAQMFSIVRGFGVSLWVAHQYIEQLADELRAAIIGTVGTLVAFRIGVRDDNVLAKEFPLNREDELLIDLQPHQAYVKTAGKAHLLYMPPCDAKVYPSGPAKIIAQCRSRYAKPRLQVEAGIEKYVS
jgi:type IV secretory pathway TraG/TraD family ATPase VirD4